MKRHLSVYVVLMWLALLAVRSACAEEAGKHRTPPIRYEVIPLGPVADTFWLEPVDLNNRGEVIGTGYDPTGVQFIWDCKRGRTEIPFLPGSFDLPNVTAISDSSQVVGYDFGGPRNSETAFIWDRRNGTRPLLAEPPGDASTATDINRFGFVLGQYLTLEPYAFTSFIWSRRFGRVDFPDDLIYARINNLGVVAAYDVTGASSFVLMHPLLGLRKKVKFPEGAIVTSVDGINDHADAAGVVFIDGESHGFIARRNGEVDLFDPPEGAPPFMMLKSINNRRQIVGANWGFNYSEAFIWDEVNGSRGLTQLVAATSPEFSHLSFNKAVAINDAGWIAAAAFDNVAFTSHAYLLVPVPANQERYRNLHLLTGQELCDALPRIHGR